MARSVLWGQEEGAVTGTSTIDGILKEDYVIKNIINTVNMRTYLLSRMKTEKTTAGRRFIFPVRFGVGEGQGNRLENETLPSEGFGTYDQAMGNVRLQYGSMYISGPAIEATEGGRATFASALKQSLKDVRDGFTLETHRQSWGDGSGVIALVDGATNATIQAVKNPYGLSYDEDTLENSQKVRAFRKNMVVLFKTAAVVRTVSSVNGDGTITLDSAVDSTDEEEIIRGDSTSLHNEDKEYLGVNGGVKATGTYLTLARAGQPAWQGNIHGDGVSEPDLLVSEHTARRIYANLLTGQKRFPNTLTLKGGFKALEFNGMPWVVDKMCPPQRLYYLNTMDWVWFIMKQIGWVHRDGTVLKWVDQKDAYRAVLAAYREFVCKQPANQTVVENIVD
jgi:hypothetical protein